MTGTLGSVSTVAWLSCAVPLYHAWLAERHSPLMPTVLWLMGAWAAGIVAGVSSVFFCPALPWLYAGLVFLACAFVSVLGARTPGVGAWNFVTLGLLAVLSMPFLEQPFNSPQWMLDTPWVVLLGGVLLVGAVNYAPTRWGGAALGLLPAMTAALAALHRPDFAWFRSPLCLHVIMVWGSACLWIAWGLVRRTPHPADRCTLLWLAFRDKYGVLWAKRVQEQLNTAAAHAGLYLRLTWQGSAATVQNEVNGIERQKEEEQLCRLLLSVLKRFGIQEAVSR